MNIQISGEIKNNKNLNINLLEVVNNSAMHKGHLGDDGSGETHFLIKINSIELNDLNRVQAHRKINDIVKEEFNNGLHALEIKILTN